MLNVHFSDSPHLNKAESSRECTAHVFWAPHAHTFTHSLFCASRGYRSWPGMWWGICEESLIRKRLEQGCGLGPTLTQAKRINARVFKNWPNQALHTCSLNSNHSLLYILRSGVQDGVVRRAELPLKELEWTCETSAMFFLQSGLQFNPCMLLSIVSFTGTKYSGSEANWNPIQPPSLIIISAMALLTNSHILRWQTHAYISCVGHNSNQKRQEEPEFSNVSPACT